MRETYSQRVEAFLAETLFFHSKVTLFAKIDSNEVEDFAYSFTGNKQQRK